MALLFKTKDFEIKRCEEGMECLHNDRLCICGYEFESYFDVLREAKFVHFEIYDRPAADRLACHIEEVSDGPKDFTSFNLVVDEELRGGYYLEHELEQYTWHVRRHKLANRPLYIGCFYA